MNDFLNVSIIAMGGFLAGFVNAIAGGGTLISFPMLTLTGIPFISANITSTVSLSPGYLSAAFAQFRDLKNQKARLLFFLPVAATGGITGGILLLLTGEKIFQSLVPFLILLASLLLAFQDLLKKWLSQKNKDKSKDSSYSFWTLFAIFAAAIYGGYFGAGLSVIVLAVLALSLSENLTKLNALKQIIGFAVNMSTAIFFMFSKHVVWSVVFVMATGSIIGGWTGGKLAGKIKPITLRYVVVSIGIIVSVVYFIK